MKYDSKGPDSKEFYRLYENGQYKNLEQSLITSRHNNVSTAVLISKSSWGLHVDMWSDGIVEWCFTVEEILEQFEQKNIKIPDSLLTDFYNRIETKKRQRNSFELSRLYENGTFLTRNCNILRTLR